MLASNREIQKTFSEKNDLFPIFLKLSELNLLIIGGGSIGLEKLSAVLRNSPDANVNLVAPIIRSEIVSLADKHRNVNLFQRVFIPEDLENMDLIIAATNDNQLNRIIKLEAESKGILTNVADTPDLCDFYLSSIVQKGSVKLAISTNGKSPTVAKRLREVLDTAIPDKMEESLDNLVKIRKNLNGNFAEKVKELNRITSVLVEEQQRKKINFKSISALILIAVVLMILGHLILKNMPLGVFGNFFDDYLFSNDINLYLFIAAGFIAQMIDGILGMAYGVSATTFLLALGISPAVASASVHTSEIFTSGASGLMHLRFGNVSKNLFKKLLLPGVIGSIVGAFVLSYFSKYDFIVKPIVASYTLILGLIIVFKAIRKLSNKNENEQIKHTRTLAGMGGFLDSAGGGGWGPIVASSLIAKGNHPVKTIGSVNLAEFFVTFASSAAFAAFIGFAHYEIIIGLVIGGILAAPFAAKITGKLHVKTIMILIGLLVIVFSLRNMLSVF